MLGSLPVELRIAAFCFIGAVILTCIALLVWPKRDARPDDKVGPRTAAMRAQARHRDRGTTSADKGAYHPDELSQADTDPGLVIRKLPGQDRLTRRTVTGPDIADWPDQTSQPAVSAVPDDPSSGATSPSQRPGPPLVAGQPQPEHLPTTAMPALGRPAVPGAPAQPPGAPPAPTAPRPAPPDPATTLLPRAETRAERRIRLKAEAERQDLKDQKPPQRPVESSGDPGTPT